LNAQLADREIQPGHVELLNMLARSAGFRNFQHFRATHESAERLQNPPVVSVQVDYAQVERIARYFDGQARLMRWPSKFSHQKPCLWILWSRLQARQTFAERQINDILNEHHLFGDYALLRRELVDYGFVTRTVDGRAYCRVEQRPPAEVLALLRHLDLRRTA
jgi:hypothetical protein